MAGVLIYKNTFQHYSFVIVDDNSYEATKAEMSKSGDEILWEKGKVSPQQIENARETKNTLVARLNAGLKVDLEKELSGFFQ